MTRRRRSLVAAAVVFAVAALSAMDHAGWFGYRGPDRARYDGAVGTITYAADGDTIDIDIPDGSWARTRVRLWGVDCPEIAHEPGGADAWYGREAAEFVRGEIVGREVRLELDPLRTPRDKYGRLLAYVYLIDGDKCVNERLIARGLGYADRRFDHVMKQRFVQLEKTAMKQKTGLWAEVTPDRMPDWRRRMDAAGAR